MHPNLIHQNDLSSRPHARPRRTRPEPGPLRRWLRRVGRQWMRRRMIAEFQALDDRILRDIGIARGDIRSIVDELCDRELSMVPRARVPEEAQKSGDLQISEPSSGDVHQPDAICRLAA
ncbi:DUF1127 domain-containing protein [uncultured Jannaschia sp.]|uniref:DUF1127 domain-containing protein n=1 Tax=uncultured Jannaschia sp. TaxID=293347 RepID=UPI00262120BF|nr:DUF1127 domain-containing protein [uncultured Jannaschia sp.]